MDSSRFLWFILPCSRFIGKRWSISWGPLYFIFRLEQCFALYPDFLTNVEIEAKVIAALQKAESYIVHLKEQHRQHLLETANSQ